MGGTIAQNTASILRDLENTRHDSSKIALYHSLVDNFRYRNSDSAIYYAAKGLEYAEVKGYAPGRASMIFDLAQVNERHGYLEQAKQQYSEAQRIFIALGDKLGFANATSGLGVVAGRTGKYDEATRYFLKALTLFEEAGSSDGIVRTYIKLGVVSDLLGNVDDALRYYLRAEAMNTANSSSGASLSLMNNIGIIYGKRNDLQTAIKFFQRGLRNSDPQVNTSTHIALLGSLGLAFEKSGVTDSAWYYQQQALSMARLNALPEEEARALVNLAALVKKNDAEQSMQLLNEALVITERIQQLKLTTEVYEAMIALYKESNEYKLALALSEKKQSLEDSLFTIEKSREIANLHATQALARQENEIKALALRNERSIFQRNLMVGVALLAVAMIGIIWYYNTKISHLNCELIARQNELKDSNTIKDKLFSILGHDLRAPMIRVIGFLNVLAVRHHNESDMTVIEKLRLQSQSTLETLDNLLMWGQNQLKGIRLNQQTLRARDHVKKSILLTSDYAAQKNIRLIDNIPHETHIQADPSHFDFVIRNLLSNAIKFSHSGGSVSINATQSAEHDVVFSVHDSGVGIDADHQEKIFSDDNESVAGTWHEKGTGLGLMLCREYVIENGGRLWVESKQGKGSTFYFTLKKKNVTSAQSVQA